MLIIKLVYINQKSQIYPSFITHPKTLLGMPTSFPRVGPRDLLV
jgi:hypothetical protein